MSGYRRGGYRRQYVPTVGRIAKANARPGPCHYCGETVPAGAGQLYRGEDGAWSAVHIPATWAGSPVSGQWTGGCPASTDTMNGEGRFGGPDGARPERERIASAAAISAARTTREAPRARRGGYIDECGSCGMASCAC